MRLFIDNQEADMDSSTEVSISLSVASITTIEYGRTGYSKSITIPDTSTNRAIMGDCEQIHAKNRFNSALHTARIESDGFTVICGTVMLSQCDLLGAGSYTFNILGAGKEWVTSAQQPFSTIYTDYQETISADLIEESWTNASPVKYLPVQRDNYSLTTSSVSLYPAARVLSSKDYHPFLHVKSLVDKTFAASGYQVVSQFMSSEYFNSLYMSGNYPDHDGSLLKKRMNFKAGRFANASATANSYGRVYADPYTYYNTVGNIVDTADPDETDVNGNKVDGVFSVNNYFYCEDGRVVFKPEEQVSVSFEYCIKYVTDYRIVSRNELAGFNILNLRRDDKRVYKISNRYPDRREEFKANKSFTAIVFNHTAGNTYRLTADEVTNPAADLENLLPSDLTERIVADFTTRSATVAYTSTNKMLSPRLSILNNGSYTLYEGDWALYDGYVGETGQREVSVTVRSNPQIISPSHPKYFDDFYFGGADQGMTLTIEKGTTVRPIFMPQPCEGSTVEFKDVAAHNCSRLKFINALRHMFNLYFYTDTQTRTVIIEPRNTFYTNTVVDWSDRMDLSKPLTVQELGDDMPASMTFAYQSGDGATSRWNIVNEDHFGEWNTQIDNVFSDDSEARYENPLFCPSINTDECMPDAVSASLIQAGYMNSEDDSSTDSLNFPPKIVRFSGMKPLPIGQTWGWPSDGTSYPFATFHNPTSDDQFTLCFEDRDQINGLHRFWDKNINSYNHSKRITAYLHLRPEDIEPLIIPNSSGRDFRALFKLNIDSEDSYYRLEEVCDYSPMAASTKCVFIKEI